MIASIYKIKNLINGKSYIGLTVRDPVSRWWEHCNSAKTGSQFFLHQAIKKYGEDNFSFTVILQTKDKSSLKELEELMISEHQTHMSTQKGYNMTLGGDGCTFVGKTSGIFVSTGEPTGLIDCDDPRWASGDIVHVRYGIPWPEDSRKRVSEFWKGKRIGIENGNAKRFQLISPEGVIHNIHGNCREYTESLGLKYGALNDHFGKIVPEPSKFSKGRVTPERYNTVGWRLNRVIN